MKKIFYLIITFLVFMPAFVLADTDYHKAVTAANDYIRAFEDYNEYFVTGDKVCFVFDKVNKTVIYNSKSNPEFTHGSFLSRHEYNISNSGINDGSHNSLSVNSAGKSYLSPGVRYWLVKNDVNYYYEELETKQADSPFVQNGVRVTGFVLPKTRAFGTGTANNPWDLSTTISHEYGDYLTLESHYDVFHNTQIATNSNALLDGDILQYDLKIINNNVDRVIPFALFNEYLFVSPSGEPYGDIVYNDIFELIESESYCTINGGPKSECPFDLVSMYNGMNSPGGYNGNVPLMSHLDITFRIKVNALKIGASVGIQPVIKSYGSEHKAGAFDTSIERLVSFKSVSEEIPASNIVFVIDHSGSMDGKRLSGVRQSLFSFINYVFPDPTSRPNVNIVVTKFASAGSEQVVGIARNYQEALDLKKKVLTTFQFKSGGTIYRNALNLGCAVLYGNNACLPSSYRNLPDLNDAYANYIIFLSDGEPNEIYYSHTSRYFQNQYNKIGEVVDKLHQQSTPVQIYAIGYETTSEANYILGLVSDGHLFNGTANTLIETFNSIYDEIGDAIGNYPTTKGEVDMTEILEEGLANKVSITITDRLTGHVDKHVYASIAEVEAANLLTKVVEDGKVKYYLNCTNFSNNDVEIGFYPKSLQQRNANLTNYKINVNYNGGGTSYKDEVDFEENITLTTPTSRKIDAIYDRNGGGGINCTFLGLICSERDLDITVGGTTTLTETNSTTTVPNNATSFKGWTFGGDIDYTTAVKYSGSNRRAIAINNGEMVGSGYKFEYLTLNANSNVNIKANYETNFQLPSVTSSDSKYNCIWNTAADGKGRFYAGGDYIRTEVEDGASSIRLYAHCLNSNAILLRLDLNTAECVDATGRTARCQMNDLELVKSNENYFAPEPTLYVVGKRFKNWSYTYYNKNNRKTNGTLSIGSTFKSNKLYTETIGRVATSTFTANWEDCSRGYYNDGSNYECTQCPAGFNTSGSGSKRIEDCTVHLNKGYYFDIDKNTPARCPVGSYSSFEGDINPNNIFSCTLCDNELTTDNEGSTSIEACHGQ